MQHQTNTVYCPLFILYDTSLNPTHMKKDENIELIYVIYELLSMINEKVLFLIKNNVLIDTNKLSFDNLVIHIVDNQPMQYQIILNKITFDASEKWLEDIIIKYDQYFNIDPNFHTKINVLQTLCCETITNMGKIHSNCHQPHQILNNLKDAARKDIIIDEINNSICIDDNSELKQLLAETSLLMNTTLHIDDIPNNLLFADVTSNISDSDNLSIEDGKSDTDTDSELEEEFELESKNKIRSTLKNIKNNINGEKIIIGEIEKDYVDSKCVLDAKNAELRKLVEKEEETRRVFQSEINVTYHRIKESIEEGTLTEETIPPMFAQKYPIFKFLDTENLIDDENVYDIYCELFDKTCPKKVIINNPYIPHNVNYLQDDVNCVNKNTVDNDIECDSDTNNVIDNDIEHFINISNSPVKTCRQINKMPDELKLPSKLIDKIEII
jgi:hypothetical protein